MTLAVVTSRADARGRPACGWWGVHLVRENQQGRHQGSLPSQTGEADTRIAALQVQINLDHVRVVENAIDDGNDLARLHVNQRHDHSLGERVQHEQHLALMDGKYFTAGHVQRVDGVTPPSPPPASQESEFFSRAHTLYPPHFFYQPEFQ